VRAGRAAAGPAPAQSAAAAKSAAAATAEDALLLFRANEFDLVITDYYLPGFTGAQLASDFKRLKPNLPVLLFSGSVAVPDSMGGADLFLSKAEDTETFLRTVRELLAHARAPKCD
jgi:DNA-binding NarL/FixJ family response regulator